MNRAAVLLLAALATASALPLVPASNDPPPGGGTVSGHWTVADTRTYTGVTIHLDHGNLTIQSGGSLTLDNVDLRLSLDTSGQFQIEVQAGGRLVVRNGSTISSTNPDRRYLFKVRSGAELTLSGSTIRDVGYTYTNSPNENNGVYVATQNATLNSCTFQSSTHGLFLDTVAPSVTSCRFVDIASAGVMVYSASPIINGNEFTRCYFGVYSYIASPAVSHSTFTECTYGVYIYGPSEPRISNSTFKESGYFGVSSNYYASPVIEDCAFVRNGLLSSSWGGAAYYSQMTGGSMRRSSLTTPDLGYGIQLTDSAHPLVEGCSIYTTSRPAISLTSYGSIELRESTVTSASNYGVYLEHYSSLVMDRCELTAKSYGVYAYTARCSLRDTNVTSTASTGVLLYYTAQLSADNCSISGDQVGAYVLYYGSEAVLNRTTVGGRNGMGLYLSSGQAYLQNSSIYSLRSYGLYAYSDSAVTAVNSTITASTAGMVCIYVGGARSKLDLTNTFFDQTRVTFTESTSTLQLSWFLTVAAQWQNAAPAPGARFSVVDRMGRGVAEGEVDDEGETAPFAVVQYRRSQLEWQNFTPHELSVSAGGVRRSERRTIAANTVARLTLTDPDPPVVRIATPEDGALLRSGAVRVEGTSEDFVSGLVRVEHTIGNGNWSPVKGLESWAIDLDLPDGRHLIKVRAYDRAGMSAVAVASVLVDSAISLVVERPEEGALVNTTPVRVSGVTEPLCNVTVDGLPADVDPEGNFEALVELGDGPWLLRVVARDEAGNEAVATRNITVDTLAPPLLVLSPASGLVTSSPFARIRGQTEPGAAVYADGAPALVDGDGTFSAQVLLREGNNTIDVRAVDAAGNVNSSVLVVVLDTAPPFLRIFSPGEDALTNRPLLTVAGETDGTLVFANDLSSEPEGGRFEIQVPLSEGFNQITVRALDAAGNTNSTLIKATLDTRAPFVQILQPQPGQTTNSAAFVVRAITEPEAEVTVNGLPATNSGGSVSLSLRLVPGANRITVRAVDRATNVGEANATVELDQVPPALSISSPQSGLRTQSAKIMVRGYTEAGASVTVNGAAAQMDATGKFACELSLLEGDNSIVVTAVDRAGNPTTKIIRVTLTGALSLSREETPLLLLGLAVGVALGAALGLMVSRWGSRKAPTAAPPEPSVGRYDEVAVGEAPIAPPIGRDTAQPAPPGPPVRPFEPRMAGARAAEEEYLPTVPAAESVHSVERAPPMPRMEGPEQVPWEEEPETHPSAPSPAPLKRGEDADRRVMELLQRQRLRR
ncbi:MAG: right-handed parallel beta-helix repeat-containing protein [Thermoplasmatota archaeon]